MRNVIYEGFTTEELIEKLRTGAFGSLENERELVAEILLRLAVGDPGTPGEPM